MTTRLAQEIHVPHVFKYAEQTNSYADLFEGAFETDVISMANYERCTFILQKATGATATATLHVCSCDDVTPSTTTSVPFDYWICTSADTYSDKATTTTTVGLTTTAGADQMYILEVNSNELNGSDKFVQLVAIEGTDSPCDGTVICILSNGRYIHEVPSTVLA